MEVVEEKSKGWFQDTAIVFSSSYKIGEFEDQICKCRWWRTVATQSKSLKEIQRYFFFRTKYSQFIHLGNDIPFLSYQLITFLPLWNLTPGWKAQDSADGGILLRFPKMRAVPSLRWSQRISQPWTTELPGKTPNPFSVRYKNPPHTFAGIVSAECPDDDCCRLISVVFKHNHTCLK